MLSVIGLIGGPSKRDPSTPNWAPIVLNGGLMVSGVSKAGASYQPYGTISYYTLSVLYHTTPAPEATSRP